MEENLKKRIVGVIESLMVSHDDQETEEKETIEEYLEYIDSIRFIELITAIESEFKVEICNEDLVLENVKNLDKFFKMVEKYLK